MPIAVVVAACEFLVAQGASVVAIGMTGQRCFHRFPPERLTLRDYFRGEDDPDGIYLIETALLAGYSFDRSRFAVPTRPSSRLT